MGWVRQESSEKNWVLYVWSEDGDPSIATTAKICFRAATVDAATNEKVARGPGFEQMKKESRIVAEESEFTD